MAQDLFSRQDVLQRTFPDLNERDLQVLSDAARETLYEPGAAICREGEVGTTLFVLLAGQADIYIRADSNQEILIKSVQPADFFGEMALLGNTTRSATVRAVEQCRMLEVDQEAFTAVIKRNPALLHSLVRQISEHLRNNDRAIINELRQKNAALAAAYADLAQQERQRAEFIATLSHELRTPLTAAQGFLHLINYGRIQGESLHQALQSVTRNVEQMGKLVNNLLVLYELRLSEHELSYCNVNQMVHEAVKEAENRVAEMVTPVTLDIAPNLPAIHGSMNALVLALCSIIENAFKFSPEKTPISITVRQSGPAQVQIIVTDQGIGIPLDLQAQIFEPFYRAEGSGGSRLFPGLGLGLPVAKFIVERHGGRIEVESQPQQGSTMRVYLPC